mgnify:CR=1 FL=1
MVDAAGLELAPVGVLPLAPPGRPILHFSREKDEREEDRGQGQIEDEERSQSPYHRQHFADRGRDESGPQVGQSSREQRAQDAAVPSAPPPGYVNPELVPRPTMHPTKVTHAPTIDAVLDEAEWKGAEVLTDFLQQLPNTGMPARFRTEVRVLYDADHLYISAENFDPEPGRAISAGLERDFQTPDSDIFGVALDTFHDRRNAFAFQFNPIGGRMDGQVANENQYNGDGSTVAFTMTQTPANSASVIVAISGVVQDPTNYTVSGTTLTFSTAPPTGTNNISCRYLGLPTATTGTASVVNATNGIIVNNATISASYTIPSGSNAMSTGPVSVASGVTVTIPSGSRWAVI